MMMPFERLKEWLELEKSKGVSDPEYAVLATADSEGVPHSRVVAIREIEDTSLLFFTQRKTRKVSELLHNPRASLNFLFSMQLRQIILEGRALPLSLEENKKFWDALPRERQLRFSAYAPTSGEVIEDIAGIEKKKQDLMKQYKKIPVPVSEFYCGFRFIPETLLFYTVGTDSFSEVIRYSRMENSWKTASLSP